MLEVYGVKYLLRKAPRRERVTRKYLETRRARNVKDRKEGKSRQIKAKYIQQHDTYKQWRSITSNACCDVPVSNYLNSSICFLCCGTVMFGVPLSRLAVSVSVRIKIASGMPCRPCLPTQPSYPSFSLSPVFSFHLFPAAST